MSMVMSEVRDEAGLKPFGYAIAIVAGLGLAFQVGHFFEHGIQFLVWLTGNLRWVALVFCGPDTPYMTGWATNMVLAIGSFFYPNDPLPRQMLLGLEILHLVGNSIFLVSIACLYYVVRQKWIRWAFYVEAAHLCEHLALFLTAYYFGKPYGLSTLFGYAPLWFAKEWTVGYRVSWHFVMNLIPPMMVMTGMAQWLAGRKAPAM